jgi:hypothetical protein
MFKNKCCDKTIHSAFIFFRIFFANGSFISLWRDTASIIPFLGFIQSELIYLHALNNNQRFLAFAPTLSVSFDKNFVLYNIVW